MINARTEPRNRKITMITISSVSESVVSTSSMASWMYSVESYGMPTFMPAGSCAWMPGISARTWRIDVERVRRRQHPDAHERRASVR